MLEFVDDRAGNDRRQGRLAAKLDVQSTRGAEPKSDHPVESFRLRRDGTIFSRAALRVARRSRSTSGKASNSHLLIWSISEQAIASQAVILVGLALLGGLLVLYQVSILNTHLTALCGPLDVVARALWCPTPWRPLLQTSRRQSPMRWVFNIETWYCGPGIQSRTETWPFNACRQSA